MKPATGIPQRWLVLGSSGAGKSTLAVQLGRRLNVPVIHLDRHYWRAGWVEPDREEWDGRLRELLSRPAWIMDGNFDRTLPERLKVAQVAVFLDLPPMVCRYRVLRRIARGWGRTRPDMADGCPEKLDAEFLRWVWAWPRDVRPAVVRALDDAPARVRKLALRTPAEVRRFLVDVADDG